MEEPAPYNPLAKSNLATSIVAKLLRQNPEGFAPSKFVGAGIYTIYYTGDFAPYRPIAAANRANRYRQPIYVGKAVPAGSRKGGKGLDTPHGYALWNRLADHADSIEAVSNLSLVDFKLRWLVVDEVFIPLGETLLIAHFRPLWNLVVDGFGNHDPGGGRSRGKKPMWDVIHPGRKWAENLEAAISKPDILTLIERHFANWEPPAGDFVE